MRKSIILATGIALVSASAFAADIQAPTIYGKISKEYRSVSQDQKSTNLGKTDQRTATGVVDVSGSETRLGAKGTHKTDMANFDYVLELGLRTSSTHSAASGAGQNIRIRLSNVTAKGMLGSLTVGRHYTVGSLEILGYDPMAGTGLQATENDTSDITNAAGSASNGGLGYTYQGRDDGVTYRTPEFFGFQYGISQWHDRDLNTLDQNAGNRDSNIAHLISYNNSFGPVDVKALFNYVMTDVEGQVSDKEDSYYNLAVAATFNNFTLSFIKGVYNEGKECVNTAGVVQSGPCDATYTMADVDNNVEKMFVGLKYRMNDWTFMGSYATASDEDAVESGTQIAGVSTSKPAEATYTQMAAGVGYDFSKNVNTKLLYAQYEVDFPQYTDGVTAQKSNDATSIIGHVTVTF